MFVRNCIPAPPLPPLSLSLLTFPHLHLCTVNALYLITTVVNNILLSIRLSQLAGATNDSHSSDGKQQQLSPEAPSLTSSVAAKVVAQTPLIDEEKNDIMRAGLLSKVFDHISLLVEDWFVGVRPRTSVIPCPFCSEDISHDMAELRRSFSDNPILLSPEERAERGLPIDLDQQQTATQVN